MMTDHEWYALMQSDSREGRRALIEQYGNLVYAIVLNKLKGSASREDIEDCVSEYIEHSCWVVREADGWRMDNIYRYENYNDQKPPKSEQTEDMIDSEVRETLTTLIDRALDLGYYPHKSEPLAGTTLHEVDFDSIDNTEAYF